jgi:hypothetical protein
MKKIKILVLLVTIAVATFYSCTDNNAIENETITQKSIALRTTMNELKISNNISDKNSNSTASNPFCFEFVYPITLSYNTGTTVTVSSLQGLLTILANENPSLYIDGISFPFQVMHNGAIQTISTEGQYISLLMSCGFNSINTDLLNSFCFDLVFPITYIYEGDLEITITSQQELTTFLNNPSNETAQLVYPISVNYNNQIVQIDNIYELYQMINNCDDCVCTQEFVPVCVQTPTGILEFGNFCFAQCAGYTQNDLVNCDPTLTCSISNLSVIPLGFYNPDFTYPITINFSYVNSPSTTFVVRKSSGQILGTYPLSNLPLTIPDYPQLSNATDFLTVELGNGCSETQSWVYPSFNCVCPTNFDPVCVQTPNGLVQYSNACLAMCAGYSQSSFITCPPSNFSTQLGSCFNIAYPIQVQFQGALVTVTSSAQLLQYYFPAQGPIPAMNYPITVTFGSQTFTFANQAAFQSQISASCN